MKNTTLIILLLSASLNSNAFDVNTIEGLFDEAKKASVQFYKDNKDEINEITSKTSELYATGKEKTTDFVSKQEKRYQEYQAKHALDIKLIDNKFYTSEGEVPAGCFYNLAVEDNGDDLVRSVYLNRGYLRGCIAANITYPGEKDGYTFDYNIIKNTAKYEYDIQVCVNYNAKYRDCDKFSIRFMNFDYRMNGTVKQVLGVEKIGN